MNTGCLPKTNVAIEKDLLKAGAERLGVFFEVCFEQALLLKPAILLPSASTAPSLSLVGTNIWKHPGKYASTEIRLVAEQFLEQVPHSTT